MLEESIFIYLTVPSFRLSQLKNDGGNDTGVMHNELWELCRLMEGGVPPMDDMIDTMFEEAVASRLEPVCTLSRRPYLLIRHHVPVRG